MFINREPYLKSGKKYPQFHTEVSILQDFVWYNYIFSSFFQISEFAP